MKKFFSLVLTLVMALSLTTIAWGALTAVDGVVTLDPATPSYDIIPSVLPAGTTVIDGQDAATINVFEVTPEQLSNLTIKDVTITGRLSCTGNVANLTLDNVTFADGAFMYIHCVAAGDTCSKVTVKNCTFEGTSPSGTSRIMITNPTNVTITGNTIANSAYHGVLFQGTISGTTKIVGNTITGTVKDGFRLSDFASGAVLELQGNTITSTPTRSAVNANVLPTTVKAWNNEWNDADVMVDDVASAGLADTSSNATTDGNGMITGGTFTTAPAATDVADGYETIQLIAGSYVVVPAITGSSTAAVYDLHKADSAATEIAGDIGYVVVAAAKDDSAGYTIGTLEYVKMDGKLFVKVAANKATTSDFYVTNANQKTPLFYLKQIDSVADISYDCVAVEFKNIGMKCDQLNAAYVDYHTNEVGYYVWTHPVTGEKIYFADDIVTTGDAYYNKAVLTPYTFNILVGNEVIEAYAFADTYGDPADPLNQHIWAPIAYDKTTPVKAMCGLCGTEAVVYKDGKAPAGSKVIDQQFNGVDYDLVITSAGGSYVPVVPTTPSTDKTVTSAQTFDAGIAMYVGMSVMAAAGSAVVIGKKKD